MQLTVGKVIWAISIILVLFIMYNSSWFKKVESVFTEAKPEIVQTFIPKQDQERPEESEPAEPADVAEAEPEDSIPEYHFEMLMEIEKLKWELQNVKERLMELTARNIAKDSDNTMGDVTTILVALLPIVLPYVTRKYNNKEIFKKG